MRVGGASSPRYFGSMSTYIKEIYNYYMKQKFLETEKWTFFLTKGGGASRPV